MLLDSFFPNPRSAHVTPPLYSLQWLPISRNLNTNSLLCLRPSGQVPTFLSDLLHFYTASRQLRSSADSQVFKCHPCTLGPVVNALTRLHLPGTNSWFISCYFLVSILSPSSLCWKKFSFHNLFFNSTSLRWCACVSVCMMCVCA